MDTSQFLMPRRAVSLLMTPRQIALFLLGLDWIGLLVCWWFVLYRWVGITVNGVSFTLLGFSVIVITGLYLVDAYRLDIEVLGLWAPARILLGNLGSAVILATIIYLSGLWGQKPVMARSVILLGLGGFTVWAIALRYFVNYWVRIASEQQTWLVLGKDAQGDRFTEAFATHPVFRQAHLTHVCLSEVTEKMGNSHWSGIVITHPGELGTRLVQQVMRWRLQGAPVYTLPDFYEQFWYKIPPSLLQERWFAFSEGFRLVSNRFHRKLKRILDILLSTGLLVLLAPLMGLTALIIRCDSSGSPLYSQLRTGLRCQPFRVYKFRSMYQDAEKRGVQWAIERDPRVTRVGYWLRLMRIDELPQLWNVLRGDMSLIGPRPERPEFDTKLSEEIPFYDVRYLVKPGITGWAQVMYPYGASVEDAYEKLSYDLYYIKNYSIWLDIAIALKTIRVILLGKGR